MDEDEKERILYRLDARTKRVDENINRIDEKVSDNEDDIEEIKTVTLKNRKDLKYGKGVMGFIASTVAGIAAKIIGILSI